ncbi:MAG: AraC family transcriptional regulator, partial [Tidjanibacter sp.]|nr:AraC family transcriptional regulator [Tidjanibacter sp.]
DKMTKSTVDRSIMLKDGVLIWICRAGSLLVSVDGTSHTIKAGQMLIVFAGTYCRFTTVSPDFLASTIVGRINEESSVDSIVNTFPRLRQIPVISLLKQENKVISSLMEYIAASSVNYRNYNRADIDRNILAILRSELVDIFLRRNLAVKDVSANEQLAKRFNMMLITSSFEHRDVEFYADLFGLTPKKFSAKIKRVTGMTPSDMIADAVIKNAKRLLLNAGISTTIVSERMNFATPSFFCRYFKRYTGQTPQEWRQSIAKEE